MIIWPSALPNATIQRYAYESNETIARTQMDSGVARQRQRFTSVPTQCRVRWLMKKSQLGVFEAWYRWKAKEGAEWVQMRLGNGLGTTENQVRFTKPYRATPVSGDTWEVTAELEVREFETLTEEQLDFILTGTNPDSLTTYVSRLHAYVHETLPLTFGADG